MTWRWFPEALAFIDEWGIPDEVVEAAADNPMHVTMNAMARSKGYPVEDRRRGDITAVVGLRETEPSILYVRCHLPLDSFSGTSVPGGGTSSLPRSMRGLRSMIVQAGYTIELGGAHDRVLDPDGNFALALPRTPSDKRTIPNAWRTFVRARDRRAVALRVRAGDLLTSRTGT
jgi:hypothetical protein